MEGAGVGDVFWVVKDVDGEEFRWPTVGVR
jgi:hypothetical protein